MKYLIQIIIPLALLGSSCHSERVQPEAKLYPQRTATPTYTLSDAAYVLVFIAEDSLEIWAETTVETKQLLRKFALQADKRTPVGVFSLPETFQDDGYLIEFPNDFYKNKRTSFLPKEDIYITPHTISDGFSIQLNDVDWVSVVSTLAAFHEIRVLIFPNDARKSGNLTPCLQCPLWMAEIYSSLYVHLQAFTNEPADQKGRQPTTINF